MDVITAQLVDKQQSLLKPQRTQEHGWAQEF